MKDTINAWLEYITLKIPQTQNRFAQIFALQICRKLVKKKKKRRSKYGAKMVNVTFLHQKTTEV